MNYKDDDTLTLSFWAIGDLHYRAVKPWHDFHTLRLSALFDDLQTLWREEPGQEGRPAFYVSPGDIIETCAPENYALARSSLVAQLGDIPFYPGIGNHEYQSAAGVDAACTPETFSEVWGRPVRYSWLAGNAVFIMLDYPDPRQLPDPDHYITLSQETLAFLDATLAEHADRPAVIMLHCPLRGTVGDRGSQQPRDYHSFQNFFSPENSDEVRSILAARGNARLFLSGHTHSGWEAPGLVVTEQLGGQPVTFVNLMSPWYTGRHTGPRLSQDLSTFQYLPDDPDVVPSFSFRLYQDHASIRVREHASRRWLKEWHVPFPAVR